MNGPSREQKASRKGIEERLAFQEMLGCLLGNGCRTIIVESLDRLAREYRIQEQILIYLSSKRISLVAANSLLHFD